MIVCICRRVSDRDIAEAAREGCASFDELQAETGVATGCGKCRDCARETFHHHVAAVESSSAAARACAMAAGGVAVHVHAHPHHQPQHEMMVSAGA